VLEGESGGAEKIIQGFKIGCGCKPDMPEPIRTLLDKI
jgi:hypothetical protein